MVEPFLQELRELLANHDASISFSVSNRSIDSYDLSLETDGE